MDVQIVLDPDPPILHAVQLNALIDHYLAEQAHRLQSKTVVGYARKLRHFRRWWQAEGQSRAWCLDESTLYEFAAYLRTVCGRWGRPLAYNTRRDVLRRLRQVFHWAHGRGYITIDFAQFVPSEQGSAPPRLPLTLETLAQLLDACDETNEPMRNRAIIAMLAGTGVRCEECAALQIQRVKLYDDGSGYARLSIAKNDKLRGVAFDRATGSFLRLWMDHLGYSEGPLFPSRKGRNRGTQPRALTPSGLYKILVRVAQVAGVRAELQGAHDLRRLYATTWHKTRPEAVRILQKQLGHASLEMTMHYVLDHTDEAQDIVRRLPVTPMAQLDLWQHQNGEGP